jgi:hypothetical protein
LAQRTGRKLRSGRPSVCSKKHQAGQVSHAQTFL